MYWQAKSWRRADTLEFRVMGDYVDKVRKEFESTFEYKLGGKVKQVRNRGAIPNDTR